MASGSLGLINPKAEVMRRAQALAINVAAAEGLKEVLQTNLGPKGTLKLLVSGAGELLLTKDGSKLLHDMQIAHPTAIMIARSATAQDDITGDGTTSVVLFTGDLLKFAERHISDGVHPRIITEGFELARLKAMEFLDGFAVKRDVMDRELLLSVARTSLLTKLEPRLAEQLTEIVTDAVRAIHKEGSPIDLHMVERMHMLHKSSSDTRLVRGLVLDHGARHPDMPRRLENVYIMIANLDFEYEKTADSATAVFSSAAEREKMVAAERRVVDEKVKRIIEFKRSVCTEENGKRFMIINQKGIDPLSLEAMARDGILALRRAKRRNMERLMLSCGGLQLNTLDDLSEECLGFATKVWEESLGDDKYTFVEAEEPHSVTILMRGPNPHTIAQLKDAVRDGLRAVKNTIEDGTLVPGGGAFEIACAHALREYAKDVTGKAKLGIHAFADALLVVPRTLAANSGFDVAETIIKLEEEFVSSGAPVGLDLETGGPMSPEDEGVWDNYAVKKQGIMLAQVLASQLLLVDEVLRAGRGARNE